MQDINSQSLLCSQCSKWSVVCKCRECEKEFCKSCCSAVHASSGVGHVVMDITSQSRLCQLHDWEKLTVYSIKSKAFGCIRCFHEGPLKGHHGLSLQVPILLPARDAIHKRNRHDSCHCSLFSALSWRSENSYRDIKHRFRKIAFL
jgi:hypothetical protein